MFIIVSKCACVGGGACVLSYHAVNEGREGSSEGLAIKVFGYVHPYLRI